MAHFAVDDQRVRFCTQLKGKESWFLPFDQGWDDGAGNPPNPFGLKTDYLWRRILAPASLANIIENYAQVVTNKNAKTGKKTHAQIFPRYHQLRRISDDSGSTKGALTCQDLKVFRVPVASLVEQEQIVQWIHDETNTTEAAADRAAREIELLREFRTRLTADVVTGQLDIRDAAALLPELDPADLVSDVVEQDEDDLEAELAASLEEVDA